VFDTDALRSLVAVAESVSGRRYGQSPGDDVALRVVADHARTMTFLVNDGVAPSNEDRGYVLRSVVRRAVRRLYQLGVERPVLSSLVDGVIDTMTDAYPELGRNHDAITSLVVQEEERFRQTLRSGSALLEQELASGRVTGEGAFKLHDTFGFPIEITEEVAAERGVPVDRLGFDEAMAEQRRRARASRRSAAPTAGEGDAAYRDLLADHGPTEFTGYAEETSKATVLAVLDAGEGLTEIFLDRTPFYAEGGGQVGDTGTIETDTGRAEVLDTTAAAPGLHRHTARILTGRIEVGQDAAATIDAARRNAIRRNHTGTHLLHWALREMFGPQVRQQSSYVGPDRLRFDFNHSAPMSEAEIRKLEDLVNERVLANEPVRAFETTKAEAEVLGAIAFFGDKYGDIVRVVEAGTESRELCGGTHVGALGTIGPFKVISESSIGSNLRRIEATTGTGTLQRVRAEEEVMDAAAARLRTRPEELVEAVDKVLAHSRALEDELKRLRSAAAQSRAGELAATAVDGIVVERIDGLDANALKTLAVAVRDRPGIRAVVLAGSPDGQRVALVAAVRPDSGLVASELLAQPARTTGGGGGQQAEVATAGGRHVERIDEALVQVRDALRS
jgi:alanyl-tRNA synthetase